MSEQEMGAVLLGATALVVGPLVWWVVRRAAIGALPSNPIAGIRTTRTMASPEAWVVGHRAALPITAKAAVVSVVLGLVAVVLGVVGLGVAGLVVGFTAVMGSAAVAFPTVRAAHRSLDDQGL